MCWQRELQVLQSESLKLLGLESFTSAARDAVVPIRFATACFTLGETRREFVGAVSGSTG